MSLQNKHGSLVVAVISSKGEYVAVAGESRNLNGTDATPANDDACKLISLGDALFFHLGSSVYGPRNDGAVWDANDMARKIYRRSASRNAHLLALKWVSQARQWFGGMTDEELQRVLSKPLGKIATGGFVTFDENGTPSVEAQDLFYDVRARRFRQTPDFDPPHPGQLVSSGRAKNLIIEFFARKSERAVHALDPTIFIGVDPEVDADVAKKSVQFAIDNSTGDEHAALHGPIDVVILRRNRTIEWVSRKPACYREDESIRRLSPAMPAINP